MRRKIFGGGEKDGERKVGKYLACRGKEKGAKCLEKKNNGSIEKKKNREGIGKQYLEKEKVMLDKWTDRQNFLL